MKRQAIKSSMVELRESVSMSITAISAHKLRSALTVLGVLIGVFSIIVVMTAMRVLQHSIESNLSQLGTQTFAVSRWPATMFGDWSEWQKYWRRPYITLDQCRKVSARVTLAASVGIEGDFWEGEISTRYAKTGPSAELYGETPGSFPAHNWEIDDGRPLTDSDVDDAADVCVLGSALAKSAFPYASPVGEVIKINGYKYHVVGVLQANGASLEGSEDNFAIIPITTALNRYGRWWDDLTLLVEARDTDSYEDCMEQVRGVMRAVRKVPPGKPDDFELYSNDSLIQQFHTISRTASITAAVVSSIALIAAGIGIMNIMLVSVTERTREIGIRRAIGAKKRNIMTQFVLEAIVLCQVGGIVGVGLGVAGGNLLALAMKAPPVIPVDWVILGLLICSAVGIIFGSYPAYKAANLDPIESLRYE